MSLEPEPRASACRPEYDPYVRRESTCFRNLFKKIDVDNSGEISTDELQEALSLAFPATKQVIDGQEIEKSGFNPYGT